MRNRIHTFNIFAGLMQQDAILCLRAGCHLNFLERQVKFHDADEGFRHNETEGRRGRKEEGEGGGGKGGGEGSGEGQ